MGTRPPGTPLRRVTTVAAVEAIVGRPPQLVLLKVTDSLDDGCRSVLARAPVAGLGFRAEDGVPCTTLVGGAPGFARVESPTRLRLEVPAGAPRPVRGGCVSMVFLLPGIGETLRFNGSVAEAAATRLTLDVHESFVHCARCVLRSRLWHEPPTEPAPRRRDDDTTGPLRDDTTRPLHDGTAGPLLEHAAAEFLASSPFVLVSSWDGGGRGDTSPKGDLAGFVRVLDGHTLVIPDRRGNRRADTLRNVVTCTEISLAALVPGRDDVLHLSGTAAVTDDPACLAALAVKDNAPHAALVVHVERAELRPNEAVRAARLWDQAAHVDGLDLMKVAAGHLARNKAHSAAASVTRLAVKGLAASPGLARRAIDAGYRKELRDEGYES